jgi:2,5-diketo-D-gluconate reductase A
MAMEENLDIFKLVLSEDEMPNIEAMDEGINIFMGHNNPEHMNNFFTNHGFVSTNEN